MQTIRHAAVIGSGVMGSAIAAHLAGAGISCLMLDIAPTVLTAEEEAAGYTLAHPKVRNRLANNAMAKLKKMNPALLYDESLASNIITGNLDDHLHLLADVDWVIEAVTEKLDVKKDIMRRIESTWKPGMIVSSNTSGISINKMVSDCGAEFQRHFLGTHFFNPPRYMKLLEIIPGENTDPKIVEWMSRFCEQKLGKGVVLAKDTPNFIANRIGTYSLLVSMRQMTNYGYSIEEVDAVTGPVMGRPKSATFRTLDVVGLDTMVHVINNVSDLLPDNAEKEVFQVPVVMQELVDRGWIGAKHGQGFYNKVKGSAGKEIQALHPETFEYAAVCEVQSASLNAANQEKQVGAKLKALLASDDRYSTLAWNVLKPVLLYSAEKLGEIADSIVVIDQAMKWGFNWELGPFETWDAIGLVPSVQRMESEGLTVPAWVKEWIRAGNDRFYEYRKDKLFYCHNNEFVPLAPRKELISLSVLKQGNHTILSGSEASLIDLGNDVACLEFHSKHNEIGTDLLLMIRQSVHEVIKNYRGLVIANEGRNFCVGANLKDLLMLTQKRDWDEIDLYLRMFQDTLMMLKYLEKPVVAAPHRMTLGGGAELCLAADQIMFAAETYFGLVETGVGLIPAGGGCKELALRISRHNNNVGTDIQPELDKVFETIGMARVSTSGYNTKNLGLMRQNDAIVMNQDFRIYEAMQVVLRLEQVQDIHWRSEKFRVAGEDGRAVLQLAAFNKRYGGYISEHDQLIWNKLAFTLTGGSVPARTWVTEQYMLDLEREACLSLIGEIKTQERIRYMLATGKPLRN